MSMIYHGNHNYNTGLSIGVKEKYLLSVVIVRPSIVIFFQVLPVLLVLSQVEQLSVIPPGLWTLVNTGVKAVHDAHNSIV